MASRRKSAFELGYLLSFLGFAWILHQRHHGETVAPDLLSIQVLLALVILVALTASYFSTARMGAQVLLQRHGRDREALSWTADRMDDFAHGRHPDSMSFVLYAGMAMASGFVLPTLFAVFAHIHFCRKASEIAGALRQRLDELNGPQGT